MKSKKLVLALAMAGALSSSQAFAQPAFQSNDVTIFISGASAPDKYLAAVLTSLFDTTTVDEATQLQHKMYTFLDNGGTQTTTSTAVSTSLHGILYSAYEGIMKSDSTIPSNLRGKKVRIIKRSEGGSVFGVNSVARETAIGTLHISNTVHPTENTPACVLSATANTYMCTRVDGTGAMVPDLGVSDVNPIMFKSTMNSEIGVTALNTTELQSLTTSTLNAIMMGLAVTDNIPTSTYFSKANYGAILNSSINTWAKFGDVNGVPLELTTNLQSFTPVICRRTQGSGTQASYNWYFSNFPCGSATLVGSTFSAPRRQTTVELKETQAAGADGSASSKALELDVGSNTFIAIENLASGEVRKCLKAANAGGVHTFQGEDLLWYKVDFGGVKRGAIGVLSVDSHGKETSSTEGGWTFRNMDGAGYLVGDTTGNGQTCVGTGVCPTQFNLVEGRYDFAAEITTQYKTSRLGAVGNELKLALANLVKTTAAAPVHQKNWTASLSPNATWTSTTTAVAKGTRSGNVCNPLTKAN